MCNLKAADNMQDFLEEVTTLLGRCECGSPECTALVFHTIGKESGLPYEIGYDPEPVGTSNFLISIKKDKRDHVVFDGRCDTETDLAQVLRMVII